MAHWITYLAGAVSLLSIGLLIIAIRTSYAIERIARGGPSAFPMYTNFFSTAFGEAGRASPETLRLRARLRLLLLSILVLMAGQAIVISVYAPA